MAPTSLLSLAAKDQRLSRHVLTIVLLLVTTSSPFLRAADREQPALLLGGSYERPPIYRYLPGSKRTIIYPAELGKNTFSKPLGHHLGMSSKSWDQLIKKSEENSLIQLATLDPKIIRDRREIIQMAVISTDDPTTASLVLLPSFLGHFSAIFGPELIVAIPARNKIYIFPKLANELPRMADTMREDYLISPMPVSTEIFELSKKGLRTIGNYDPNDN
jgi:hypothetical protein